MNCEYKNVPKPAITINDSNKVMEMATIRCILKRVIKLTKGCSIIAIKTAKMIGRIIPFPMCNMNINATNPTMNIGIFKDKGNFIRIISFKVTDYLLDQKYEQ